MLAPGMKEILGDGWDTISPKQPQSQQQPFVPAATGLAYVMTFGKHKGKVITEVPPQYLQFLKEKGFISKNHVLADAYSAVLAQKEEDSA